MRFSLRSCLGFCPALLLLALTLLAGCADADAPPEPAPQDDTAAANVMLIGDFSDDGDAISAADAAARADELHGQTVRVEGPVRAICQMAGCWLQLGDEGEMEPIRVNVPRDENGAYVFTFPQDVAGADALVVTAAFVARVQAQKTIRITGDRLSGFVLPVEPLEGAIRLEARRGFAASSSDTSCLAAYLASAAWDLSPTPRLGTLTTRSQETSSAGFTSSRRYASTSLISRRS